MAENAAPASVLRGTPTYHQSCRRRLSNSKASQNTTLASAQTTKSAGRAKGEEPCRARTAPSSARTIPHQAIGKRKRSTASDTCEATSAKAMIPIPAASLLAAAAYPETQTAGPHGDPAFWIATWREWLLLLLIVRTASRALGRRLGRIRIRDAGLAGARAAAVRRAAAVIGRAGSVALHALLAVAALLADDLDLLRAVRLRVIARADLLALVEGGDAASRGGVDADDLGRVVDLQGEPAIERDAVVVLVDARDATADVLRVAARRGVIHRAAVARHRPGGARLAIRVAHVARGARLPRVVAVVVLLVLAVRRARAGGRAARPGAVLAVRRAGAVLVLAVGRRAALAGATRLAVGVGRAGRVVLSVRARAARRARVVPVARTRVGLAGAVLTVLARARGRALVGALVRTVGRVAVAVRVHATGRAGIRIHVGGAAYARRAHAAARRGAAVRRPGGSVHGRGIGVGVRRGGPGSRLAAFHRPLLGSAGGAGRPRFLVRTRARSHQGSGCDRGADMKFHLASSGVECAAQCRDGAAVAARRGLPGDTAR